MYCEVTLGGQCSTHSIPSEYAFDTSAERFGDLNRRIMDATWYSIACRLR
jgi:hypothetical protein